MGRGSFIDFNTFLWTIIMLLQPKRSVGNKMLLVYRKKLVKAFQIVKKMKRKVWKKDVQRLMMKTIVKMTLWFLMDISQKMR